MPNNPKLFIHRTVIYVTFTAEEGLPLSATPFIEAILESVLARAQTLYPVVISHYIVMANHVHLILVVGDPACVSPFVGYLKGETSHAINQLLGREKHTVWADGFDSPIVLDAEKVIDHIVYIYTNPTKANLVDKIEDYPNYSSWNAFLKGGKDATVLRIPRACIPKLPKNPLSLSEQKEFAEKLKAEGREECHLVINPDAWMDCFDAMTDKDPDEVKQRIINEVRRKEREYRETRENPVLGKEALQLEPINKEHQPKKLGQRTLGVSSVKELRIIFIAWCRELFGQLKKIDLSTDWLLTFPPGLFLPGGYLRGSIIPSCVPTANTVML